MLPSCYNLKIHDLKDYTKLVRVLWLVMPYHPTSCFMIDVAGLPRSLWNVLLFGVSLITSFGR